MSNVNLKRVIQVSFDIEIDADRTYEDFIDSIEGLMDADDYSVLGYSFVDDITEAYY